MCAHLFSFFRKPIPHCKVCTFHQFFYLAEPTSKNFLQSFTFSYFTLSKATYPAISGQPTHNSLLVMIRKLRPLVK